MNTPHEDKLSFKYLREQLIKLDAYPKTLEDFRIKTFCGATGKLISVSSFTWFNWFIVLDLVTSISIVIILILFCLELNQYLTPFVHEELMVDISNNKKLTINFDILFPHVVCSRKFAIKQIKFN